MAEEVVRVRDSFYILSTSARLDDRTRVLKNDDTFANFDRFGDIERFGTGELGLYYKDTRFLSRLVLRLMEERPLLLSSTILADNAGLAVDLMNPDLPRGDDTVIPRGAVHLFRAKLLWRATCYERLTIHNYGNSAVNLGFSLVVDADFADIFEVRGATRKQRGRLLPPQVTEDSLLLAYEGLDGRVRRTRLRFAPPPVKIDESGIRFQLKLEPRGEARFQWTICCELEEEGGTGAGGGPAHSPAADTAPKEGRSGDWYRQAEKEAEAARLDTAAGDPELDSSNSQFNDLLACTIADLHMLRTETEYGPYPYAGVPWYSTVFGRDGIITALECLWYNPGLARGVLSYLAARQADRDSPAQDAMPGKVLHEVRVGEMAALGEVPFALYYGSVDATPLFVMLAGAYYLRTGDLSFARSLWPHVERALQWIDRYGDLDGDGFVEYSRRSQQGLLHQGWKDSQYSVFHRDGTPAEPPIALCEVQGYVYAARRAAAALARGLEMEEAARDQERLAEELRRRFEEAFWCEELSTYALALDGKKQQCRVVTSNAGHCLYTGIAGEERARRVAATLTAEESFSGWGIRTVAAGAVRYNPMAYHNGSVWPHDNALVAAGFARYGLKEEAAKVLTGLFDAGVYFDQHRLPELFCGFNRRAGASPTLYPVSCAPQAWASGSVLMLLQACLGLEARAAENKLIFTNPYLPEFLKELRIRRLRVGDASLDLSLTRHENDVGINVLFREGHADVVAVK